MRRLISVVLTMVMSLTLFASLTTTASAGLFSGTETGEMQDTSAEGNGTIYWEYSYNVLDGVATLRLSGDGYMPNATDQSWYAVQQKKQCYITELIIENGVRSIMEGAFSGEMLLENVTLPSSIEFIGDYAFSGTGIKSVTIPEKIESFNGTIFNSDNIVEYKVHSDNPYLKAVDGVLYSKDLTKLIAYPVGRYLKEDSNSFTIPETVREIGRYAFLNASMKSIKIPGTVKDIQYQAFAGCSELTKLTIENGVKSIYDGAFLSCDSLKNIHLPTSVQYIGYCSLGFIYVCDLESITNMLDSRGTSHEPVTIENAEYYALLLGYTIDTFRYCTPNEDSVIYAPKDSAGHKYCEMFDVNYRSSQAITPRLLSAEKVYSGVKLKWSCSSDADGYYIYKKDKSGKYQRIATLKGKNNTSYIHKSPYSSYKNTYTVKAYNDSGTSRYKKSGISIYYVGAPKLVSANNTTNGIKVVWNKVPYADNYLVYRKLKGEGSWERIGKTQKAKCYFIDETATNNNTYYYTVRAYDDNGISAYNKKGVSAKYVSAPQISSIKNSATGVRIGWNKVSDATSYRIYRKTQSGNWTLLKKLNNATFSYTDTTAKSGVTYQYSVRAVNSPEMSGYSYKTIKYLKKPEITSAKSNESGITVEFDKITGAKGYRVFRKNIGDDSWTRIAIITNPSTVTHTDTTAKKGETYLYTVRAYNGSYSSAYNPTGYKIKDQY